MANLKIARPEHPRIVLDKHLDAVTLAPLFSSVVRSANNVRPRWKYEGTHTGDEDFYHILQLAWEDYATILTADGEFFNKVRTFQADLARRKKDRCFNGVLIVSHIREEQVRALKGLLDGATLVRCKGRPGGEIINIEDVSSQNLGVDFRDKVPRAVELCACKWG